MRSGRQSFSWQTSVPLWRPRISLISSSVDRHLGFSAFGDRGWHCCGRPLVFKFSCEHQCQFLPCMSGRGFTAAVTVTKCDGVRSRGGWEGKPRCPGEVAACPSGDTGRPSGWWGWGRRGQCIRQGSDSGSRGPVLAGCSGQGEGGQTCPWNVQRIKAPSSKTFSNHLCAQSHRGPGGRLVVQVAWCAFYL